MQQRQTAGIDLPFKALIWQDEDGQTWLTYNDPAWLADRHDLGREADPAIEAIAQGMAKMSQAVSQPA